MLEIEIREEERFDPVNNRFIPGELRLTVRLEHSLRSLSKWEEKWEVPFLSSQERTREQTIDYIRCMALEEYEDGWLDLLGADAMDAIQAYIQKKATATTVTEEPGTKGRKRLITSELVYFWMSQAQIPWEAQDWHLNRLLMLLRVHNVETMDPKKKRKVPKHEQVAQMRALNEKRRQELGTSG